MLARKGQLFHPSARSLILAIAVGIGLLTAIGIVALRHVSPVASSRSGPGYMIGRLPGEGPLGETEKRVTLDEAVAKAPYHLYRPQDPLASDKTTEGIWTATFHGENTAEFKVAIDYQSGVEVLVKPNELRDVSSAYSNIVEEWGTPYVTTVQGSSALVIPEDSDGTGGNPGSVDMVIDGVEISIIGHMSDEDLLRVANTVT